MKPNQVQGYVTAIRIERDGRRRATLERAVGRPEELAVCGTDLDIPTLEAVLDRLRGIEQVTAPVKPAYSPASYQDLTCPLCKRSLRGVRPAGGDGGDVRVPRHKAPLQPGEHHSRPWCEASSEMLEIARQRWPT